MRGLQVWALLTRVLLTDRPLSRRELAAELFPETADPLGALRWCLAAARRALEAPESMTGDPVRANLPDHVTVDLLDLAEGRLDPAEVGDLLEGVNPRSSVEFELWLLVQRERVASQVDALLRREVMAASAIGDLDRALTLAEVAARRQPLDEGAQILLVASLRQAGRHDAAAAAVDDIEARFAAELGTSPTPALRSAARRDVAAAPPGVPAASRARSLLEAGQAALATAAVDAGIESLRHAARAAEEARDDQLLGRCLRALGERPGPRRAQPRPGGGATSSSGPRTSRLASATRRRRRPRTGSSGTSTRSPGGVRPPRCTSPAPSRSPAPTPTCSRPCGPCAPSTSPTGRGTTKPFPSGSSPSSSPAAPTTSGASGGRWAWVDGAGCAPATTTPPGSGCGSASTSSRTPAGSPSVPGRPRCWPRPSSPPAARVGRPDLHHEFALSCQLADPCWEGGTARVLALESLASHDPAQALRWIDEARSRVARETDVYVAMQAAILATDIEVSSRLGHDDRVSATARALLELAARGTMDDHVSAPRPSPTCVSGTGHARRTRHLGCRNRRMTTQMSGTTNDRAAAAATAGRPRIRRRAGPRAAPGDAPSG